MDAREPGALMWGVLHIVVIALCLVYLMRTAAATLHARFVKCLAYSLVVTGVFYVLKVMLPFLQEVLVSSALAVGTPSTEQLLPIVRELENIDDMWPAVDSLLSLFSTFWIVTGYHLLRRFPESESIDREFIALMYFLFGALVSPILMGVLINRANRMYFTLVDTFLAGASIVLFGWGLISRLRPVRTHMRVPWLWIQGSVFACFLCWGAAQPFYLHYGEAPASHPYFRLLLLFKFLCCMATAGVASLCLQERPGFESDQARRRT